MSDHPRNIIHLCGQGGAGKSSLLKELQIPQEQIWDVKQFYIKHGILRSSRVPDNTSEIARDLQNFHGIPSVPPVPNPFIAPRELQAQQSEMDWDLYNELKPQMMSDLVSFLAKPFPYHIVESRGINSSINSCLAREIECFDGKIMLVCLDAPRQVVSNYNTTWSRKAQQYHLLQLPKEEVAKLITNFIDQFLPTALRLRTRARLIFDIINKKD